MPIKKQKPRKTNRWKDSNSMIRNAFVATHEGELLIFEPDLEAVRDYESDFLTIQNEVTNYHGASICLSQTVTIDALLSIQQIIQSELTVRADIELNPELYSL